MSNFKINKNIYFVRHGQSEDNVAAVYQGPDSPLSEKGKRQAEMIAKRALNIDFDILISSPLERAKQTASVIGTLTNKSPEYSKVFVERIKPTILNGRSHEDLEAVEIWNEWHNSLYLPDQKCLDGENFSEIIERADEALNFLLNKTETNILVVTHAYFIKTIIARVLLGDTLNQLSFKNFQTSAVMKNTGLTVLQHSSFGDQDSKWHLWTYNDHSHLAD